jgi:phosphoadenosine phosphosulfate reductase
MNPPENRNAQPSQALPAGSLLAHLLESRLLQFLQELKAKYPALSFASSLGAEDMVLTDFISRHDLAIDIFTLDTGRLHPQTYELLAATEARYAPLRIRVVSPEAQGLETLVAERGINGFLHSVEARKQCCAVRKIEPLKRALGGAQAWLTGLRRSQSEARGALELRSLDPLSGLPKYNPLLEWSDEAVQGYLSHYQVPVNALHAQGFPSIGCAPCTRAIQPGEHPRAGRWWWEQAQAPGTDQAAQECGLHIDNTGRLVRSGAALGAGITQ